MIKQKILQYPLIQVIYENIFPLLVNIHYKTGGTAQ